MKVKEFNELKKQVKKGDVKGLNKEVIRDLTLRQAQSLENLIIDMPLNDTLNGILDELVIYIDSLVEADKAKKVANKKQAPSKTEKVKPEPAKTEVQEPAKKGKDNKPFNKVKVGDTFYLQVEGETIEHEILVIFKGRKNIVGIMADNEDEVFKIRKTDFNKKIFEWTDRKGETYNIIITLK